MFLQVKLPWNVVIPAEILVATGLTLQMCIVVCLLEDLGDRKATEDLGYYHDVTTLESIGEGRVRENTGEVVFPVVFSGITFKVLRGEILEGIVQKVLARGVFLKCGPIKDLYLSSTKMPGYHYVQVENPIFLSDNNMKIEKDVVVRVVVIATRWLEEQREFQALVSLEGDFLGPVSL